MKTIYGFPFLSSYDYAERDDDQTNYRMLRRLPVFLGEAKIGTAFPRWNPTGFRILLDIVFDEEPDEGVLKLKPVRRVNDVRIPRRVEAIGLEHTDELGSESSLLNYLNAWPDECECGAAHTAVPTVHLSFCPIQPTEKEVKS